MVAPISLQLYTLRDALAQDFAGVIRRVADMGYIGVETAGFPGTPATEAARLFREMGLQVSGAHVPLPLGDKKAEVLETMDALGCRYLICAWLDPDRYFGTPDQIRQACDLLNEASAVARANGLILAYHNHWFEYQPVAGRPAYQYMLDYLDPGVVFEVDTYWVKTAGCDPVEVVRTLGHRAPLLHIKDGPCVREQPMVAVGAGSMDFPAIITAAETTVEWLVVELDRCATDILEAVQASYNYLTGSGLARGNVG
jgi:sugar phosphate isomerase/epimerase